MSYNGSGTFNINSAGQPVVAGTVISATAFNALTADLGVGLSTAITKDGQTTTTARITFAQGVTSSLTTDSTSTSTGSIITAGGVGIAKALFVGTTASIAGVTTFSAGTVSLPAITTTGDTNTGIYFPAADTIAFTEGGTESMRIDSTGNVGIGTSSPAAPLHVFANNGDMLRLDRNNTGAVGNQIAFRHSNAGTLTETASINAISTANADTGTLAFYTKPTGGSSTERMRIDSSGNLGIGTSSPSRKLTVSGSGVFTDGTNDITLYNDGSVGTNGSVNLKLVTAGTTKATLDTSGNLGLGVTPSAWLSTYEALQFGIGGSLIGRSDNAGIELNSNAYRNSAGNYIYLNTDNAASYRHYNGVHQFYTAPSGTAGNAITFTQAMTLDASGNLGIGITSPSTPLHVQSNSSGLSLRAQGRSSDGYADISLFNNANTVNNAFFGSSNTATFLGTGTTIPLTFQTNNTERMRIDSSGRIQMNTTASKYSSTLTIVKGGNSYNITSSVTATDSQGHMVFENNNADAVGSIFTSGSSTAYNTSSDYRLKEDIAPMTGALAKVALLKPCIYKWKVDGSDGQGFIAHELAEVCPDAVTGEKDAVDADGKPQHQGVDASFLVATLTAAIQEQQALIQDLTTRLAALESKA